MKLEDYIRPVKDHPEPGILFRDVTPLLANPDALRAAVDWYASEVVSADAEVVLALDARGFLFGAPVAYKLGLPLTVVRKSGKLPPPVETTSYELEYGDLTVMEMRSDAAAISQLRGKRLAIVDDLLATGGTFIAAAELAERAGAVVVASIALIELSFLEGRAKVVARNPGCKVVSRIVY